MEVLRALLPLLITCLVVLFVLFQVRAFVKQNPSHASRHTYLSEGMSLGLVVGVVVSLVVFQGRYLIYAAGIGLMLGLYIGLLQPKSRPTDGSTKENNVSDT